MTDINGVWKGDTLRVDVSLATPVTVYLTDRDITSIRNSEDFTMNGDDVVIDDDLVVFPIMVGDNYLGLLRDDILTLAEMSGDEKENPSSPPNVGVAVKNATNFNMKEANKFTKKVIDLPCAGDAIAHIGRVTSICYTSDKEGFGDDQIYIHEFKSPYPNLYMSGTNTKPVYIIEGGITKISEPGDDSGEAPGWMVD